MKYYIENIVHINILYILQIWESSVERAKDNILLWLGYLCLFYAEKHNDHQLTLKFAHKSKTM